MMTMQISDHVKQTHNYETPQAGRSGTVLAVEQWLRDEFGEPTDPGHSDSKVRKQWAFETPRGIVVLRDYWWNSPGREWSVSTEDWRALIWFQRFLKDTIPGMRFLKRDEERGDSVFRFVRQWGAGEPERRNCCECGKENVIYDLYPVFGYDGEFCETCRSAATSPIA